MLPRGVIKSRPEDFVVEELPLYEPSGTGEHLYIRFTKRELTTDVAVRAIARAMKVDARDVGVAGLKDKVGVTTQTISLLVPRADPTFDERARALALDGITIHDARRHGNKLRTGHLAGNRFTVVVRGVGAEHVASAIAALLRLEHDGVPNLFGSQRFGREGDNAVRARAWLEGRDPGPREPKARRFLWSSLQSAIFNDVLRERVADGTWATPMEGDLLQKTDSGGLFLCTDVQADRARADRNEVVPTGPIPGVKMKAPEGAPLALETRVMKAWLGEAFDLARVRSLGEGARRPLKLEVKDVRAEPVHAQIASEPEAGRAGEALHVAGGDTAGHSGPNFGAPEASNPLKAPLKEGVEAAEQARGVRVYFVLPKGAYATTVLASAFALDEAIASPARPPTTDATPATEPEGADGAPD